MHSSVENIAVINVRITHKTADVPLLEAVAFKDKGSALAEIRALADINECVIVQTCNRLEIYAVNEGGEKTAKAIIISIKEIPVLNCLNFLFIFMLLGLRN